MIKEKYMVNIGNLKILGSAEDIHKLARIYGLAACEYGYQIIDEIHDKHRDTLITELATEQKEIENIEKCLINAIKNSDYYKEYSSKMSGLIDGILEEIEYNER